MGSELSAFFQGLGGSAGSRGGDPGGDNGTGNTARQRRFHGKVLPTDNEKNQAELAEEAARKRAAEEAMDEKNREYEARLAAAQAAANAENRIVQQHTQNLRKKSKEAVIAMQNSGQTTVARGRSASASAAAVEREYGRRRGSFLREIRF